MQRRQTIVQPVLLACLLAVGFGVVWATVVMWSLSVGEQLCGPRQVPRYLFVREDGTPLISSSPSAYQDLRTLDGTEVPDEGPIRQLYGASLYNPSAWPAAAGRLDWSQRIVPFADGARRATFWYFLHDGRQDGGGYFVGFDAESKQRVGYIGVQGFQPAEPSAAEQFPVSGESLLYTAFGGGGYWRRAWEPRGGEGGHTIRMIAAERLLEIDFRARSVRTLFEADRVMSVGSLARRHPKTAGVAEEDRGWQVITAIRTPDHVILREPKGDFKQSYLLPPAVRDAECVTFYEIGEGQALLDLGSLRSRGDPCHKLIWLDTSGRTLREEEVHFPAPSLFNRLDVAAWIMAAAVPAPAVAIVAAPLAVMDSHDGRQSSRPSFAAYRQALMENWLAISLVCVLALVAAGLCYRQQQRYARRWTAVWVVFVLLGGIPALIGYLCQRRRSVLETCSACGRSTPRDGEHCARCAAEFPAPPRLGIEVFDPVPGP